MRVNPMRDGVVSTVQVVEVGWLVAGGDLFLTEWHAMALEG